MELISPQIYEISLTVSTGSAESDEVYGLLRSDTASVKVQVSARGSVVPPKI